MTTQLVLFSLAGSRSLGEPIAAAAGVALEDHEERDFDDGEHKARPLVSVLGRDCYVVHSLHSDTHRSANDKLCRLLFFLGALRDAGAARVTAVVPYLCYSRKDRRTKPRDPVTTRYVATLLEAVGTDRVVTVDVHNLAAYENAFRCPAENLEAGPLFVERLRSELGSDPICVVSPDAGGTKRAEAFRQTLSQTLGREVASAVAEKYRSEGVVSGQALVGDVSGRVAVIVDDLISSGTTLTRAARACLDRGAERAIAVATHGTFTPDADRILDDDALQSIFVANTISPLALQSERVKEKLHVLDTAPLIANAIRSLAQGSS